MRALPLAILAALTLGANAGATGALTTLATPNASIGGMSPNGDYVAAFVQDFTGARCIRYVRATGVEDSIPTLNECTGINDAGTLAGSAPVDGGSTGGGHDEAALVAIGATDPELIPSLDGFENTQARGVTEDGNLAVGITISADQTAAKAFLWTRGAGTVELPVDSGNSAANRISPDGSVVVGWADEPQFGNRRAVIWQNGVPTYPKDAQDRNVGEAQAVSANGRFVVGLGYQTDDGQSVAWRWDADSGTVIPIANMAFAGAVSDDGRVVVGDMGFLANRLLVVWVQGQGTSTLSDFLADRDIAKPAGWVILSGVANGLSRDGSVLGACCGPDFSDFSLHSFVVSGLNDPRDKLFAADFEAAIENPIVDSGFEATTLSGGQNPDWEGLDTNPSAVSPDDGPPTCFYSATFGGIATHRGLWSVFFGGWQNGEAETQDFSQSVVLPAGTPLYVNYWRLAAALPDAGTLTVTVDGQTVQSTDLATLPQADLDFVAQSADVGAFADGAAHAIRISFSYPGGPNDGFLFVDDVTLAATPISGAPARPHGGPAGLAHLLEKKRAR